MEIINKIVSGVLKIMKAVTANSTGNTKNSLNYTDTRQVKRVLLVRPNHQLGNQLLMTPVIIEVSEIFPNCRIDLFVKGNVAHTLFQNYSNIDRIIELPEKPCLNIFRYIKALYTIVSRRYDLVVNVDKDSLFGRFTTGIASANYKFYGETDREQYSECPHLAKQPVQALRNYFSKLDESILTKQMHDLDLRLSTSEINNGKAVRDNLVANKKGKTICIFPYATGRNSCLEDWWIELYEKIKELSNVNIIEILPVENTATGAFSEPAFYSNNLREIGALIKNTALFIGADSGLMHVASSVHVPTIGLFTITDKDKYEPYNEGSIAVNTNYYSSNEMMQIIKQRLKISA